MTKQEKDFYQEVVRQMSEDPKILAMRNYPQHGSSNTLQHSINVAMAALSLAEFMHIPVDVKKMARGAMLHDFYLYNIKESGKSAWRHGTGHAAEALRNSEKNFALTEEERDIIYSHMWPLNITHVPHYKESVVVSVADKYCALKERIQQGTHFVYRIMH